MLPLLVERCQGLEPRGGLPCCGVRRFGRGRTAPHRLRHAQADIPAGAADTGFGGLPLFPRQHPLPPRQPFFFRFVHGAGLLSLRYRIVGQAGVCGKAAGGARPAPAYRIRGGAFHRRPQGVEDDAPYKTAFSLGYSTFSKNSPFAGSVGPARRRSRLSSKAGMLSGVRLCSPASTSVPARMRTILYR